MRNVLLQWLFHQADRYTNFPRFQGAQRDHVRVQSSSCCFPRASLSFALPRASLSFDQWHVTRSPPIRKRIWVGRYNKAFCSPGTQNGRRVIKVYSDPHRNLSDQLQSQARTNVNMSTWCRHVHVRPHCFILTEACSCRLNLAYFAGKISKTKLVCKNAVALAYYGSCRLLVMGFC